eukprot:CAMPEP_0175041776 /NCGR_PEP_ID=MMETSP0052_2-20121109/2133_1 /TAXON_ID=51329 ORGANISM="Polytomella parva, Strain SAG 63-3" /NCGR_SAMPLE_ID=MMETSP0052_2 /ASSEMBLY_ACC=CAM_ASM_000194 /LENGTH=44 /DNA_ID= /DNA_START= /DNA_END= /DNA_ORIENTATION=
MTEAGICSASLQVSVAEQAGEVNGEGSGVIGVINSLTSLVFVDA